MDPRKPDAQDDDANIVDDFGREERILERSAEVHPVSKETEVVKIVVTGDRLGDPLQMFQPEFDETEPPPARLGIPESRNPERLWMAPHHLGYRSVSTVTIVTISMILLGSALLSRGDVSALLDDLVFGRDDTSPVLEVRPRAVVTQDVPAVPASTPTPVTSTKRPAKVQQPRQPGRNLVANVIPRTRVRDTAPPRPSRPGSAASLAITPPSPLPATLERERLAPRVEERSAVPPAPSLPPVAAAVAPPPMPDFGSAPPVTIPNPPPASLAPVPGPTADTRAVAVVLNRYQQAFSAMDVGAAAEVWPSVDVKALAKAFDQLEEQRFDLQACNITVAGVRAEAECGGNARYIRKVGGRALRVEPRHWRFTLRQANDNWVIDAVDAR